MSESSVTTVEHLPLAVVVHVLARDLRTQEVDALCSAIDGARVVAPALPFILDMTRVTFAGSMAFGTLVGLSKEFGARQQLLILVNLQTDVRQAIEVSRISRILDIMLDVPSALRRLDGDALTSSGPEIEG
jgi:anti-anti-sigma factor